jgi:hypothetical protein
MIINETSIARIVRGAFRSMRYNANDVELRKAMRCAMRFVASRKVIKEAA